MTAIPVDKYTGYGKSSTTFTIPNGADGDPSPASSADLGRNFAFITISCASATGIASNTTMTLQIGRGSTDTVMPLWKQDGSGAWTSGTLPTSGGFTFLVPDAFGARFVRIVLSNNTTGSVSFTVRGFDQAIGD